MRCTHDAFVIDGYVYKQAVKRDVLLGMGSNQVVKLESRDREHRLAVQFGVVQPIQQVNASGPGGRYTNTQSAGELCVPARHERRGFLMPRLDESNLVLRLAQSLYQTVHTIS